MLRKKDELQFPYLYNHIRLRQKQGLLIFLSCSTLNVENHLLERLKKEFDGQMPIKEIPVESGDYAPLQYAVSADDFSQETLHVICKFPYDDFSFNRPWLEAPIKSLVSGLNISRNLFPQHNLKVVFICPPELENRLALEAPDFYQFNDYSATFTDDAAFHRQIEEIPYGGQQQTQRIAFLEETLKHTVRREDKGDIYYEMASIFYERAEYKLALKCYKQATKKYKNKNNLKLATVLENIGRVYSNLNQNEKAQKYLQEAIKIYKQTDYRISFARVNELLGIISEIKMKLKDALKHYSRALGAYEKNADKEQCISTLKKIAELQIVTSEHHDAEDNLTRALAIATQIGHHAHDADLQLSLGRLFYTQAKLEKAIVHLKSGTIMARKIHAKHIEANCLLLIGVIYSRFGQMDEAMTYLNKVQPMAKSTNDPFLAAECKSALGEILIANNEHKKALTLLSEAISFYKTQNKKSEIARNLIHVAIIESYKEENQQAIATLQEALTIAESHKYIALEMSILVNLGLVLTKLGRIDEALPYLDRAQALAQNKQDPSIIAPIHMLRGRINHSKKQKTQAYDQYKRALELFREYNLLKEEADLLIDIGTLYLDNDEKEETLQYYRQSLHIYETIGLKKQAEDLKTDINKLTSPLSSKEKE